MGSKKKNRGNTNTNQEIDQYEEESLPYEKMGFYNLKIINKIKYKTNNQKKAHETLKQNIVTFLGGPAGTAKSFFCVIDALESLKNGIVSRIVITRPTVDAGQSLGFLPGGSADKMNPYLLPILDHIDYYVGQEARKKMLEEGIIEICPLQHMRGRNFNHSYIIIDESQNATKEQLRLALTRIGESSKCAITFDDAQIDLKNKDASCFSDILIFQGHENIGFFKFEKSDIVRSDIVKQIIEIYETKV